MWTLYNLVASRGELARALDKVVVILNPVYNPDGHERYVVYYDSVATGSSDPNAFEGREPSSIFGRLNHYRFDMNRDRVAFSQDETKAEFAEMLRWNPQVYIDQHGQVASYFFPPEPMSINQNVDRARNAKWTDIFGRASGKAFDAHGFGYFTKEEFDFYYPGYVDSSNSLTGAIGMTHETDGGRRLASEREDGSVVTLRRGMEKHFLSALTVVQTAADNAQPLLADYAGFKRSAVSGAFAGKFKCVVVCSDDANAIYRLQHQLEFAGVRSAFPAGKFRMANAHDYWTGASGPVEFGTPTTGAVTLLIPMAQPQGPMGKALLEPGGNFEPEFIKAQVAKKKAVPEGETYPGPEEGEFYDFTGWALPYAYNVRAWWCENDPPSEYGTGGARGFGPLPPSSVGYAIRYGDDEDLLAAVDALDAGLHVSVTTKVMRVGKDSFPAGTFLVLADRNEDGYEKKLGEIVNKRWNVHPEPLSSAYPEDRYGPGSGTVHALKKPNTAIVMGSGENLAEVGAPWFLFERTLKLPFTLISSEALSRDIDKYTAIVVPRRASVTFSPKLKEWVSAGGHLVVLDMPKWAIGHDAAVELTEQKEESRELPGSLFRAELDSRSELSYGYPAPASGKIEIAVPIAGDHFYMARKEGGSVVTFSSDPKVTKLLTGWSWPNETEKVLQGTVFLQDAPMGRGHVVLFAQDPTERAMWPGLNKLLLNAILFGG
jgi:hypothetical protein